MTRILLTGVNGQVGWELARSLATLGTVIPTCRQPIDTAIAMDLSQPDRIRDIIREIQPHLIINAAAYTAVDQAEAEPELAMAVNGIAPGIIAEEAKRCGAGVIHYSTDYVFDGEKSSAYIETDQPHPLNTYGQTKLAGEQNLQAIEVPFLILRTSWVYGLRGKNFLRTMLRLAQEREELKIVADQIGAPTWSRTIAEVTTQILNQGIDRLTEHAGIYHLTASGQTSWFKFAEAIFAIADQPENFRLQNLKAIPSQEYPCPAKRPARSVLSTDKLTQTFQINLSDWQRSLETCLFSQASPAAQVQH